MANRAPGQVPDAVVGAGRCLALTGPTASGKSSAALAITARHPVEIISVDSALVYRGMDIGTAKPSAQEMALAPHHLINIRDPQHSYSAAEFVRDATRLVMQINQRGRIALLVGGTMMYLRALLHGLDDMPGADAAIRQDISDEAARVGWPGLHGQLAQVDAITAARLAPADSQRIQRALEVFRISGRPISSFQASSAVPAGAASTMPILSLEPLDRAWLHARIAERFDSMLAAGLLDELRNLRAQRGLHADLPSMRCVGYRQAWQVLDGEVPAAQLRERGIAATRQLAKRQITWLRSMPQRQVVACDRADALAELLSRADAAIGAMQ